MFPSKLQVGQQLANLVNWEGSIKVELEVGENLASFLGRLFGVGGRGRSVHTCKPRNVHICSD